eukprot:1903955-Pyramimonas_sp.AAC.1
MASSSTSTVCGRDISHAAARRVTCSHRTSSYVEGVAYRGVQPPTRRTQHVRPMRARPCDRGQR